MGCEGRDEYHDGNGDTEYSSLCTVLRTASLYAHGIFTRDLADS